MKVKGRKIVITYLYMAMYTEKCSTKSKETRFNSTFLQQHSKNEHDLSNAMFQEGTVIAEIQNVMENDFT